MKSKLLTGLVLGSVMVALAAPAFAASSKKPPKAGNRHETTITIAASSKKPNRAVNGHEATITIAKSSKKPGGKFTCDHDLTVA